MLSRQEIEKAGYTVLPEGGWLRIMPEDFPHDWEVVAKKLKFDPSATEIILCVSGVKEVA